MKRTITSRYGISIIALIMVFELSALSQSQDEKSRARDFVTSREGRLQSRTLRERVVSLRHLTLAAYTAGDLEKAGKFAVDLQTDIKELKKGQAVSMALVGLHVSNSVLGLIALDEGKIDEANAYLLASGKLAKGSPSLITFGPNMLLAKRLFEKGQRDTVLQYLDLCSAFWTYDKGKLDNWKSVIKNGGSPDFGKQEHTGLGVWKYSD